MATLLSDDDVGLGSAPGVMSDADVGLAPAKTSKGVLERIAEPITSYPETYSKMNKEAREQVGQGIDQLASPSGAWDVAKGVGNVGLGALGYVASPINAGLRTLIGKPIEDITKVPKEYTEFAASLAIPGMGLTKVPRAVPGSATAEAASRLGVSVPRAAATESIPIQSTAGALKEIPGVGSPIVKASRETLAGLDRAVDDTVAGYGSGQPLAGGNAAIEGIERWVGGKSADTARRLYDQVDSLVPATATRPLHATERLVSEMMAQRANARVSGQSPAVKEVLDAVMDPSGLNYEGVKYLRSYIRDLTPEEMIAKGINKNEAKRIYNALSQDLRGTVLDAGGPDALRAFDKADRTYAQIAERRSELAKIIGTKADASPERVMERIISMSGAKGGADFQRLSQLRKSIGPDNWNEVTSAFVNRMGRDKPGADFSGDRFKTAWDKMPENTRRLMFNSTGRPDLAKSVEDIMTLSGAHKNLMSYGNPSGTGRVGSLLSMAAGGWANPLAALGSAVGGNILARVLASPAPAKSAAQWALVHSNVLKHPSPGRIAVLSKTSENLAHAINREFGTTISGSDFMRALRPASAEDEKKQ